LIEIKWFPLYRKRVLPVRVVKNYRELWLVVDQRKAWEKGYEGAVGVGQTGVHPDQIRFFKPGIQSLGRL
jgi:hypothetical protein